MLGTQILPDIIRSTILSTRVDCNGTMPVSIFIVAPFEQGKTRLVLENTSEDNLILTDLTGMGLLEALQMNQAATTVVINDLSVVTGHKNNVNKLTVSILNGLAEEGSYKIAMPKMAHLDLHGRRVNVIACCVPDVVADKRNWWYKSGFMSRMLMVSFEHSISLQLEIHKAIQDGVQESKPTLLKVPNDPIKIDIPKEMALALNTLATRIFQAHGETGYRKHKQIRALAAGHALGRSWKKPKVEKEDLEFIEIATPFLIQGCQI